MMGFPSLTVMQTPPSPLEEGRTAVECFAGEEGLRVERSWEVVKSWRVVEPEAVGEGEEEERMVSIGSRK